MLATFSARPGPPRGRRTDAEGADMFASPVLVEGDPFWDPVAWSWPPIGILLAGTVLATIVFVVRLVLQPEEPEQATEDLVHEAVRSARERPRALQRRLDADAGRDDPSEPAPRRPPPPPAPRRPRCPPPAVSCWARPVLRASPRSPPPRTSTATRWPISTRSCGRPAAPPRCSRCPWPRASRTPRR